MEKMICRAASAIILSAIITMSAYAQLSSSDVQQIVDDLTDPNAEGINPEQQYENLMQVLSQPFNLNQVTREDLRALYFLGDQQIDDILSYRGAQGKFISVYELQAITSLDDIALRRLSAFVRVDEFTSTIDRSLVKRVLNNKQNYMLVRYDRLLEQKLGFQKQVDPEQRFKGSPDRVMIRYRNSRPGDFSVGFAFEKDAGEPFRWQPPRQLGFDHTSFHLQVLNKKRIKNLLLGDFQVQAGQGLVLGGLFGFGKGGETTHALRKTNLGGLPYTSAAESMGLRGLLTTVALTKNVSLTGFYAHTRRDATADEDSLAGIIATGLPASGLHRSEKEMKSRKAMTEQNMGMVLLFQRRGLQAGLVSNYIRFENPVIRKSTRYNQFQFRGDRNLNHSVFLNYTFHNVSLFSEFAATAGHGRAFITGLLCSLTPHVDWSIIYRNYDRNFYTFYANGFGEGSAVQNEAGLYWGLKYRWNKKFSLAGYFDLFRFPWLRYRIYSPSRGYEYLLRVNLQPTKEVGAYLQLKEEMKLRNRLLPSSATYATLPSIRRSYLAQVNVTSGNLVLGSRVQVNTFSFADGFYRGMVMAQDLGWNFGKCKISGRFAIFDTQHYDTRIYLYERDVWLTFSMPAYEGQGVRKFLVMEYQVNAHFSFWLRFAHTRYSDREEIGSGYDRVLGNSRNDLKFQMRIKL